MWLWLWRIPMMLKKGLINYTPSYIIIINTTCDKDITDCEVINIYYKISIAMN